MCKILTFLFSYLSPNYILCYIIIVKGVNNLQKTYIMFKPDAIEKQIVGELITRMEQANYKIEDIKLMNLDKNLLEEHYAHIVDKPFFPEIVEYLQRGPVIGMIVSGVNVIEGMREMMGATDPAEAAEGTIRAIHGTNKTENVIHGSDSVANAEVEIKRFFG